MRALAAVLALGLAGCGPTKWYVESFGAPKYRARYRPGDDAERTDGPLSVTVKASKGVATKSLWLPTEPIVFSFQAAGSLEGCAEVKWEIDGTASSGGDGGGECARSGTRQEKLNCAGTCKVSVTFRDAKGKTLGYGSVDVKVNDGQEQESDE